VLWLQRTSSFFLDGERRDEARILRARRSVQRSGPKYSSPHSAILRFWQLECKSSRITTTFSTRFSTQNREVAPISATSYQVLDNKQPHPGACGRFDFNRGQIPRNSIRVRLYEVRNGNQRPRRKASRQPPLRMEIAIREDPFCSGLQGWVLLCPGYLPPQTTFQSNKQFKYDASPETYKAKHIPLRRRLQTASSGAQRISWDSAPRVNAGRHERNSNRCSTRRLA